MYCGLWVRAGNAQLEVTSTSNCYVTSRGFRVVLTVVIVLVFDFDPSTPVLQRFLRDVSPESDWRSQRYVLAKRLAKLENCWKDQCAGIKIGSEVTSFIYFFCGARRLVESSLPFHVSLDTSNRYTRSADLSITDYYYPVRISQALPSGRIPAMFFFSLIRVQVQNQCGGGGGRKKEKTNAEKEHLTCQTICLVSRDISATWLTL